MKNLVRFVAEIDKKLATDFKIKLLTEDLKFKEWFEEKVKEFLKSKKKGGIKKQ